MKHRKLPYNWKDSIAWEEGFGRQLRKMGWKIKRHFNDLP